MNDNQNREAYEAFLAQAKERNWRASYNAASEDGYDPNVDWIELLRTSPKPSSVSPPAQEVKHETDAEKWSRWQAESLAEFRARFNAKSNCEALDAIDKLKSDYTSLAAQLEKVKQERDEHQLYQSNQSLADRLIASLKREAAAEQSLVATREALGKVIGATLSWNNNLGKEWNESRRKVRIYGDSKYQHTDVEYEISDDAKRYATDVLATLHMIQTEIVAALGDKGDTNES